MIVITFCTHFTEYLMFALVCINVIQITTSTATVEIRLLKYDVNDGLLTTKRCCDTTATINCPANQCDPYFNICLQDFSHINGCPLGAETTGYIKNLDHITFGNSIGTTTNSFLFHVDEYKGFIPKINAYDEDKSEGETADEKLDYLQYVYTTPADIDNRNITYHNIQLRGQVSSLDIRVGVYCDKDYYGSSCNTHCLSDNKYYCSDTGQRVCRFDSCGPIRTTLKSDTSSKILTTAVFQTSTLTTASGQTMPITSSNNKASSTVTRATKALTTLDTTTTTHVISPMSTKSATTVSSVTSKSTSISPYNTSYAQTRQQTSTDNSDDSAKISIIAGSVSAVAALSGVSTIIFFLYRRFCRRSQVKDSSSLDNEQKKDTV